MLSDEKLETLRNLLATEHEWPTQYHFKFVAPKKTIHEVRKLFPNHECKERQSAKGNYVSLSVSLLMESPDVVIAIYQKASLIEGVISL